MRVPPTQKLCTLLWEISDLWGTKGFLSWKGPHTFEPRPLPSLQTESGPQRAVTAQQMAPYERPAQSRLCTAPATTGHGGGLLPKHP